MLNDNIATNFFLIHFDKNNKGRDAKLDFFFNWLQISN